MEGWLMQVYGDRAFCIPAPCGFAVSAELDTIVRAPDTGAIVRAPENDVIERPPEQDTLYKPVDDAEIFRSEPEPAYVRC